MNWAITLTLAEKKTIERRIESVVSYVIKANRIGEFVLYDIDATGQVGNQLTKKMNGQKGHLSVDKDEMSVLFSEEGQIFGLDLLLKNSSEYRFIIRDGSSIDILGNGEKLPETVVGDYNDLDINLFRVD